MKYKWILGWLMGLGLTVSTGAAVLQVDTENARMTLNGKNYIPLLNWWQPPSYYGWWKGLGVNTMLYDGGGSDVAGSLTNNGVYGFLKTTSINNDRVIGYIVEDEPDIESGGIMPRMSYSAFAAQCEAVRAARPGYPLMVNYAGQFILYHMSGQPDYYINCSKHVDLVMHDYYPINQANDPAKTLDIMLATIKLISYVEGKKPVGAFIETYRINTGSPGPTPGQVRSQVWTALGAGCKFIAYFSHCFTGCANFTTGMMGDAGMENEVKRNNQLITALTDVIMEDAIKLREVTRVFIGGKSIMMGLYYRRHLNDLYIFAVSTAAQAAAYKLSFAHPQGGLIEVKGENRTETYTDGGITDEFTEANTAHIYKVPGYFTTGIDAILPGEFSFPGRAVYSVNTDRALRFQLFRPGRVQVRLLDMSGRLTDDLTNEFLPEGHHRVSLPQGKYHSGLYVARLEIDGSLIEIVPLIMVK